MRNKLSDYLNNPVVSTEQDAVALEEIEYEIYAKLEDFDQLSLAKSKESQEQWSIPFNKKEVTSNVRVRKCVTPTDIKFVLTNKVNIDGVDGDWEMERVIERHHFDIIKEMSKQGMIKDRYFFPINGTDMVWEIDVFKNSDGSMVEWVKIDLEVSKRLKAIPELPIVATEVIWSQKGDRTPEEEDLVCKLYSNKYITRK